MAEGILHLLGYRDGDVEPSSPCEYGVYNLTGSGPVESWAAIAERVFDIANGNGAAVEPVSTADYYAAAEGPIAPRPGRSDLDLSKIAAAGFEPDIANGNGAAVEPVSTADYYAAAEGPIAPRPGRSDLDLSKIAAAGFEPRDWTEELGEYMAGLL